MNKLAPNAKQLKLYNKIVFYLMLLAVILIYKGPSHSTLLVAWDESWYAARMVRAQQGQLAPGNPFVIEHSHDPAVVPALTENILGTFGRILGISTEELIRASRIIFPALIFILFYQIFVLFGMSPIASSFCSLVILCDPDIYYFRPLLNMGKSDFMTMNRIVNPLYNLSLFLTAFLFGLKAFFLNVKNKKIIWAVLSGILGGLLFYTSFYYWSYLALCFFIIAFFLKKQWKIFGIICLIAALLSVPYWLSTLALKSNPNYNTWIWIHGIFSKENNSWQLQSKMLWLGIFISLVLFIKGNNKKKILFSISMLGLALYLSPIITHISLQSWHWKYVFCPFALASVFWGLNDLLKNYKIFQKTKYPLMLIYAAVTITFGFKVSYRQYTHHNRDHIINQGVFHISEEENLIYDWLKKNALRESVVMAPINIMALIPIKSGQWTWVSDHMVTDLVPENEIFNRFIVYWKLNQFSKAQVRSATFKPLNGVVEVWGWGMNEGMQKEMAERHYPAIGTALSDELSTKTSLAYGALKDAEISSLAHHYQLNYLWVNKHISQKYLNYFLNVTLELETQNYVLYKVNSWKNIK